MGEHLDALTRATWEEATAASGALSVVLVELDDFGRYRDNYGPEAGELLVRRAGAVIRASGLSVNDRVGRHGAAGFLIILPGATLDAAHIPAERVLRAIRDSGDSQSRLDGVQLRDGQHRRRLLPAAARGLHGDAD